MKLKKLKVTYNDQVLFDGEINELVWLDGESGVKIEGRVKPAAAAKPGGAGLLDMLTGASKSRTQEIVAQKKQTIVEPEQATAEAQ